MKDRLVKGYEKNGVKILIYDPDRTDMQQLASDMELIKKLKRNVKSLS